MRRKRRKSKETKPAKIQSPEQEPKRKKSQKESDPPEDESDFGRVSDLLDKYNIPELAPIPEELESYLDIPFNDLGSLNTEELHMHMGTITYQIAYIDNLVANAEIEVRNLEREFTETWHNNYEGQNKKMNAERMQLESGVWEQLDVARGVLRRVEVEKARLESNYRFFSRMLSSKQGGLG